MLGESRAGGVVQAKKDRVRYDTEMSKSDGLLRSLPANDVAQWPEPVRALVASQVSAAVQEARSLLQGEAGTAVEALEEQLVGLQQQLADRTAAEAAASARLAAAQEHSQHLETELREQEAAMQAQISALQSELQHASAGHSAQDGLEAERRSWQARPPVTSCLPPAHNILTCHIRVVHIDISLSAVLLGE